MTRQLQLIPVILLLALLQACTGSTSSFESEKDALVFDVDFENKPDSEPLKFSEIIDSVSFIPIDTSQGIIGEISDLKLVNGLFYIKDRLTNSIFIITKEGTVVNKIFREGKSREEYLNLQYFDVNSTTNEISIYDGNLKQMKLYNQSGRFLRSFKMKDVVRDFVVLKNGDYLFYTPDYMKGRNRRGVWQTDATGVFKKQLVTIADDFKYGGLYPKYFGRIDNDTIGLMGGEDHDFIYHFTVDTMLVKYKVNVNIKMSKELVNRPLLDERHYKGVVYSKRDYIETNSSLFFNVTDFKKNILCVYDKIRDKSWMIYKNEDMIQDVLVYSNPEYAYENQMIGFLTPNKIFAYKKMKEIFPFITLDSNPILVLMNMKK